MYTKLSQLNEVFLLFILLLTVFPILHKLKKESLHGWLPTSYTNSVHNETQKLPKKLCNVISCHGKEKRNREGYRS